MACFSPIQADNTEAGFCCPSARNSTVRDCFSTRPLYLCLRPRTRRVEQIGGVDLGPSIPFGGC